MPFFYSQYLKDEKQKPKTKRPPPSPRSQSQRPAGRLVWHSNVGGGRVSSKRNNFQPLKYRDGKKTVHFSTIEVQQFHFDWNCVNDCFYSRKELTAMGSQRFDDAALLRRERHLDVPDSNQASSDDLDVGIKNKPKCINALLTTALEDPDDNPDTSIRGIEHFVYPELQQEMIRKKKEVQAQVIQFVKAKRPDPQGWRLANHSRMYSQWARDVALEKGRAYRMIDGTAAASPGGHSLRTLTSSASFSAASYYETEPSSPNNCSINSPLASASRDASESPSTDEGPFKNNGDSLVGTMVHQFQELRFKDGSDELRKTMSDGSDSRYTTRQSAGDHTDEA